MIPFQIIVAVPHLPLSFPLPPQTLLGLVWLMVGCWLCQCDWQQQDEQQDEQVDDSAEFTYSLSSRRRSVSSKPVLLKSRQSPSRNSCGHDNEKWPYTPTVDSFSDKRQQIVSEPTNSSGNNNEPQFPSNRTKKCTCFYSPCNSGNDSHASLTPTHDHHHHQKQQLNFFLDQQEEQKTTPTGTPPPSTTKSLLLSGGDRREQWNWDRQLEKTSNSASCAITPTTQPFPSSPKSNAKKEKVFSCAPVYNSDSEFLTVPTLLSSSTTRGSSGEEDYCSSEDDVLSSTSYSVTRQERRSLLSKNPEPRNNCSADYYCEGGNGKSSGIAISVTGRTSTSSCSYSVVGDNNYPSYSTRNSGGGRTIDTATGALEFIQEKVKSLQVFKYFTNGNNKR